MARWMILGAAAVAMVLGAVPCPASSADAAPPRLHRGFNVYPWLYRAVAGADPRAGVTRTYPVADRFTMADFKALRRHGVDFVRVPVDPTPVLTAPAADRAALIEAVLETLGRVTAAGLVAVVDLHPAETGQGWGSADILHAPAKLQAYRDGVVAFARAMAGSGGATVLELMNEPQGGWGGQEGTYWIRVQPAFVHAIRAVAPTLPLIVSGDRGGGIEGLLRVEPKDFDDPAILYSFHDYDPMVVTHQGAGWGNAPYRGDLSGVPYPPVPAQAGAVIAAFRDRVANDKATPVGTKVQMMEAGTAALTAYFRAPDNARRIGQDFEKVADWAARNAIPPARIILGEFGVYRPGASRETAIQWTRDMRTAAEHLGFAWAYFNYAPFDENGRGFSVLRMTGPSPNDLDDGFLRDALGL